MRKLLVAAVMLGAASDAQAADMPDFLRGSFPAVQTPQTRNWSGWYAGGDVGYSADSTNFGTTTASMSAFIFRDTTLAGPTSGLGQMPNNATQSTGFGAFGGRNYQWEDIVLGVEATYHYIANLRTSTSAYESLYIVNPPGETVPANSTVYYGVTFANSASVQLKDTLTFRGRAAWATGDYLPYIFGGLAVGRMDVSRALTTTVTKRTDTTQTVGGVTTTTTGPTNSVPSLSQSLTEEKTNAFVAGWTAGIGLEYMLWNDIFMRGEWEYVQYMPVKGIEVHTNNVHVGLGYRF